MRTRIFILLVLFLSLIGSWQESNAQVYPVLRWHKFYGTSGNDSPSCLRITPDRHLLIGGQVQEKGNPCTDIWILKVDTAGNKIWDRRIGGSGCDEVRDMVITPDSGIIFVGISSSFIEHPEKGQDLYQGDYFIGKLSKHGDIEWLKSYGGLDIDQAYGIARSNTWPEYFVVGASASQSFDVETSLGMTNMWALRMDDRGNKTSSWAMGGDRHDWAYSVSPYSGGDFIFGGFTSSDDMDASENRANGDGWVCRVDRYGQIKWRRIYSGRYEDFFVKVIVDNEGRIVLVGQFESEKKGKQFWFLKLTPDGRKMYENIFGDNMDEYATSISACADGGYIMSGWSKYYGLENKYIKGGEDFWVVRLDANGNVIWLETFGGRDDERAQDVVEYADGIYFAVGEKRNNFADGGHTDRKKDFWLMRIDENRCDDVDLDVYLSLDKYEAYTDKNFKASTDFQGGLYYIWDFGDGTTMKGKEVVKKYDTPGVYEITLTVGLTESCVKTHKVPHYIMVW